MFNLLQAEKKTKKPYKEFYVAREYQCYENIILNS